MVDREVEFDAVDAEPALLDVRPGVVDQDVQLGVTLKELFGEAPGRRLVGEVGEEEVDRTIAGGLDDLSLRGLPCGSRGTPRLR